MNRMRSSAVAFAVVAFGFVFQLGLLPFYEVHVPMGSPGAATAVAPDFVLAAVLVLATFAAPAIAVTAAAIAGGTFDALSLDPVGAHALAYLLGAWALLRARAHGVLDGGTWRFASLALTGSAAQAIVFAVRYVAEGGGALPGWAAGAASCAYCGLVAAVAREAASPFGGVFAAITNSSEFSRHRAPLRGAFE